MYVVIRLYMINEMAVIMLQQGLIEPPKAARGHATYIDIEILDVTKNRFLH